MNRFCDGFFNGVSICFEWHQLNWYGYLTRFGIRAWFQIWKNAEMCRIFHDHYIPNNMANHAHWFLEIERPSNSWYLLRSIQNWLRNDNHGRHWCTWIPEFGSSLLDLRLWFSHVIGWFRISRTVLAPCDRLNVETIEYNWIMNSNLFL